MRTRQSLSQHSLPIWTWLSLLDAGGLSPVAAPASKIRLLRHRRAVVDAERIEIVLGADVLRQGPVYTIVLPQLLKGLVERVRVVDGQQNFQLLAVLDHPPAFRDVQLFAMG